MIGERQANWLMWKASSLSWRLADTISREGNRLSAPFARLGTWLERSRSEWFPRQFQRDR